VANEASQGQGDAEQRARPPSDLISPASDKSGSPRVRLGSDAMR
jgi:hypothetical protein